MPKTLIIKVSCFKVILLQLAIFPIDRALTRSLKVYSLLAEDLGDLGALVHPYPFMPLGNRMGQLGGQPRSRCDALPSIENSLRARAVISLGYNQVVSASFKEGLCLARPL